MDNIHINVKMPSRRCHFKGPNKWKRNEYIYTHTHTHTHAPLAMIIFFHVEQNIQQSIIVAPSFFQANALMLLTI
jgi:hypothetical protein